jgi:hypothetical protein
MEKTIYQQYQNSSKNSKRDMIMSKGLDISHDELRKIPQNLVSGE